MVIPLKCAMPELSGIDYPLWNRLLVQLLIGERDLSPKTRLYRRIFIRLIDKSITEYNKAREAILAQIEEANPNTKLNKSAEKSSFMKDFTRNIFNLSALRRILSQQFSNTNQGRIIYIFRFTDHIENCIYAVRKLYGILERIKSEKDSPAFPRELRRLVEAHRKSIIDIRNTVEHLDERIQKNEIESGKPVMIVIGDSEDIFGIAGYEIKFHDLASVLKVLNEIAQYLLTIKKIA